MSQSNEEKMKVSVALARILPDGSHDPAFNNGHGLIVDIKGYEETSTGVAVDGEGNLTYPLVLPLTLGQRRPAFASALQRGGELEFAAGDYSAALQAYWEAWKVALSDAESAEAL